MKIAMLGHKRIPSREGGSCGGRISNQNGRAWTSSRGI